MPPSLIPCHRGGSPDTARHARHMRRDLQDDRFTDWGAENKDGKWDPLSDVLIPSWRPSLPVLEGRHFRGRNQARPKSRTETMQKEPLK